MTTPTIRSQAVATTDEAKAGGTVAELVKQLEPQIKAALPAGTMDAGRFTRLALTALRLDAKKGGALSKCNPASLLGALMQAAQLGLEPHGPLGHAWLVPFKNEVTFIIGWKGYVQLADRAGISIRAHVVYKNDDFTYTLGLDPTLDHKPTLTNPGPPVAYYAIAKRAADGTVWTHVMTPAQIDAIKRRSRASSNGPWQTDEEAMALKSVVRQLVKVLPLSSEVAQADTADGQTVNLNLATNDLDVVDIQGEEIDVPATNGAGEPPKP